MSFKEDCLKPIPIGLRAATDLSLWIWGIPIAALLVGILPLPYGYYQALRVLVTAVAAYFMWKEFEGNGHSVNSFVLIFGGVAALFNPFLPVELPKIVWVVLNLAGAAFFFKHLSVRLPRSGE